MTNQIIHQIIQPKARGGFPSQYIFPLEALTRESFLAKGMSLDPHFFSKLKQDTTFAYAIPSWKADKFEYLNHTGEGLFPNPAALSIVQSRDWGESLQSLYLSKLAVHPDFQGNGIGYRNLVLTGLHALERKDADLFDLRTSSPDLVNKLYKPFGDEWKQRTGQNSYFIDVQSSNGMKYTAVIYPMKPMSEASANFTAQAIGAEKSTVMPIERARILQSA